jgi:hypothetical protein
MDDLGAMISSVLSDPDKVRQVQEMAASLGFTQPEPEPPPPPPAPAAQGPDLSALAEMLSAALAQNNAPAAAAPTPPPAQNTAPDAAALANLLSTALGQNSAAQAQPQPQVPQPQQSGFDVSTLTNMLGGVQQEAAASAPTMGIDMNTIMKLGQAMSEMQTNRRNIDLLLALKPRLSERRARKVDDAIRVMQIVQFLPLLKESGIFTGLDGLLGGGSGGEGGGLGGILRNIGVGGGSGLLGGLLGG